MVVVEPLNWKHLLQAVMIAVTIGLLVWQRKKLHPRFITGMALMMLGIALTTVTETVHFGAELVWWLDIGPLVLYAAGLVIFASMWYHGQSAKQETAS
jgi:hypothetical protein